MHDEPIPSGLVSETYDRLLDRGYRPELVRSFVVALISGHLKAQSQWALDLHLPLSELVINVVHAVLGGLSGEPEPVTVEWLLEFAVACGSSEATSLQQCLTSALAGDTKARKSIVRLALPYWHLLADDGTLSRWNEYPEVLGFPYQFAIEFENEPDLLALRANLLYVNGHAGDEVEAVRLAADAAIRGSATAWVLLNEWRLKGDDHLVLWHLLSVGSLKLSGKDCVSQK